MKTQDSKQFKLSKRDIKSTLSYVVIIFTPLLLGLVPQIQDVLYTYMSPERVALVMGAAASLGILIKKWATDYSKKNV